MKRQILCGIVVLASLGTSRVLAQTDASPTPRPTPPAPPFIDATPDFSAWTIVRYAILGASGQPPDVVANRTAKLPKPESVTSVTKTGQVRHQTRKLKTGEQEDIWYEHANRITMESIWKVPLFEGATSNVKQPQGPDFPELSWISAGNFVATQQYQGVTYFVFETQVTSGDPIRAKEYGYKLPSILNRAYINADTRLPWLHQEGDALLQYVFRAAPSAALEVPPEYQAMFDAYERKKADIIKKPVAP